VYLSYNHSQRGCAGIRANDGSVYDLTGLPTITGVDPNDNFKWSYSVNLCSPLPIACDVCLMDAGYCQVSPSRQTIFCVGSASQPPISFAGLDGGKGVVATFTSPADKGGTVRKGLVTVNCNSEASQPQNIKIHNPNDPTGYTISFDHALGCGTGGGGALSGGSIFLILLFAGLAGYFLAGVIFLGAVKGQRGKEMIPNLGFWTLVPGLIQDGATFSIKKIKGMVGKE